VKVRSVTAFQALEASLAGTVDEVEKMLRAARAQIAGAGTEVQTVRLALSARWPGDMVGFAEQVEAACEDVGVEYVSLGPVPTARLEVVPELIAATSRVFVSANVSREQGVDWRAVEGAARAIAGIARQSEDGFGNLRFAATALYQAGIPFFPAAYHDGGAPAMALAL